MSMTTIMKVIEELLHFLARSVCAKEGEKVPSCKSLVAVLVAEDWNSGEVGLEVLQGY